MNKIKFKIQRFNPEKDKNPYFKELVTEIAPSLTVLQALREIRSKHEPGLAFRMSCDSGICGSCALRINGKAKLACKALIKDELANFGEIIIEPITNLNVLKDLVVDMEPFYEEMKNVKPWLESLNQEPIATGPEEFKKIEKSAECIWCGCCYSDCPSKKYDDKYLGPAAAVMSHRFIKDENDSQKLRRLKMLEEKDIWMCAHCEKSTENCPQKIQVQDIISELREEMIKYGLTQSDGARHALTFTKTVKKYGELKEFDLPIGTLGIFRIFSQIPLAVKMFFKRKLPPIFMKKIKNHEEITKLNE